MTATVHRPDVTAFVAAVRGELDDLSRDEIDELTGGLEADLDDAIADGPDPSADPAAMFGVPTAYAAELRAAAGLPPRAVAGGRRGAASSLGDLRRRGSAWLTSRGWWPAVRDFAITLRPTWWVARAGVATLLLAAMFGLRPLSFGFWVVFAVLTVISVEIGRRNLAGHGAVWTALIAVGNVVTALLLLPVLATVASYGSQAQEAYPVTTVPPENGLWLNGVEVRNVMPYDSQGRPLRDVQLFDENGRPLDVGESARMALWRNNDPAEGGTAQVPAVTGLGTQAWNVFPLRQVEVTPGSEFDGSGPIPKPVGTPEYPGGDSLQGPLLITPAPSAVPSSGTPTGTPSSAATN